MENQPFRGLITTDVNKAHVILTGIPYDSLIKSPLTAS